MGGGTRGRSCRGCENHSDNEPGILRFCFPNAVNRNDKNLQEISWEEFFEKFDENNLELVYQEKTADGGISNFNKLVFPESEEHSGRKRSSGTKSASALAGNRRAPDRRARKRAKRPDVDVTVSPSSLNLTTPAPAPPEKEVPK
jgi:hypothetical protein